MSTMESQPTNGTPLPPADLLVSPDYYEALASRSTEAHSDEQLVGGQYREREEALHAQLHPTIWQAVIGLAEERDRLNSARTNTLIAELMRHLPGIAPAIELVWSHIQFANPANVGWCCAGEGTIEENDDALPS